MEITLRVGADILERMCGLSFDELERKETEIDEALRREMQSRFPDADVKASSFYVEGVIIEAFDDNGDGISIDGNVVNAAIEAALGRI